MMANRNVPATPSQEELREKVNIKNVKNSEERETDNLNTNADTDSLPTVSSVGRRVASSSRSQTRIPAPTTLGPSCSTFHMGSRKYTSILALNKSSGLSANDSGIQTDSSMSDLEQTAMSATASPVPSCRGEMGLTLDEDQTLRELQRVVAEMEAEVALSEKEDRELEQLEAPNADQTSLAFDVEAAQEPDNLATSEDKSEPIGELPAVFNILANKIEQGSALKPASANVQDNDAAFPQEDPQSAFEAQQESQTNEPGQVSAQKLEEPDGTQINMEKSEQKHPPAGTTTNEVLQDHPQMSKKQTQIEEPEPALDNLESQVSEEKFPHVQLEEPSTGSVEAALQQAFANVNQVSVSPEEPADALNVASGGQTVALGEELQGEAELDLATTSEAALVTQTSHTNSDADGSVGNDRRLIHLEELLRNANNVELLRRLLQIGAEANLVDSEQDFGTQESSAEDKDAETDSVPETSTATGTATDTEASTDEDNDDEDGADAISQGFNKMTVSLMRRLMSGKMMTLAYPILFCGFAAGLIYMSRKA